MRILMIDKFYFVKGGVERYLFELTKLLENQGHTVIPFSMQHPDNVESAYASFFVDHVDYDELHPLRHPLKTMHASARVIYSLHAKHRLESLLEEVQPDIAHIHMIDHQISPSILHTLRKHGIPVIQTVHQYKLVCPNYRLYIEHKQEICERCLHGAYYNAFLQRCHKDSVSASLLITLEAVIHRMLNIYGIVDRFHVPSAFIGKKLIEGGIPEDKVVHHFLTLNMDEYPFRPGGSDYYLYYGRLSGEKGLLTLLEAVRMTKTAMKLVIVGDGPVRTQLQQYVEGHGLGRVSFTGYQSGEDLRRILGGAAFVVVPSEWYENSPFVIYEPFCMGKPVIGAEIGGIPEFVDHGRTGLLFPPGDAERLAAAIDRLAEHPDTVGKMGAQARVFAEQHFSPEDHYRWLLNEYRNVIDSRADKTE
ncbi:glycosyltransferase family 4 protein [bacterium]|nr:glycosyltransferase family 4 protein [bacterium]